MKKIGIVAKTDRKDAIDLTKQLLKWLEERGIEPYIDIELAKKTGWKKSHPRPKIPSQVDMIVVLGGDGTLLSASRLVSGLKVPILGVNLGGLGFLTEVTVDELFTVLENIIAGKIELEERIMLIAHIHRAEERIAEYIVLNDIVINKGAMARIIELEVSVDGKFLSRFRSDGLIISSPTGSTGYNLSAGGPIVYPTERSIIITPISPHTLTNRPIVMGEGANIKVTLVSPSEDVFLTLDGQMGFALRPNDIIQAKKADCYTYLVKSPSKDYFEILRTKLKWGED